MASLDEAKDIIKSTGISTIINFYHPISKRGANYEGVCPFHSDTNPSLKINDDKGIYKCFVCGAAGDSIKFVQDKLNLEFVEAVKDISSQLGIKIDEIKKKQDPKYDMALRVLNASNRIYKKVALENKPEAFQSFLKARNLNEESVKNFQIGYAPGNNAVTKYLNSLPEAHKNMAIEVAQTLGIIRQNKHGQGHYDFYRDRVTFPVTDHSSKIRGYSSRAVLANQKPKYLNSGESFIFDKGNILYGFDLAKRSIREHDSVIVVEGNMDVIMLHQFGFQNSVATQGVALSQNSIRLLGNMTKNLYLAMDSDPAGIAAMSKINLNLLKSGIIAKFVSFAPKKDPDEFLNEYGRLELQKRIDEAPLFIDYQIEKSIPSSIPETTDKKLSILKIIFNIVAPLETSLLANEKIIQCAKTLGLKSSSEDIITEYKSFLSSLKQDIKQTIKTASYEAQQPEDRVIAEGNNKQQSEVLLTNEIPKVQRLFLEKITTHPECSESQQITEMLDFIDHFEVKRIVEWLTKIYSEIDESDYPLFIQEKLKETLPEQIKSVLASSLFNYKNEKLDKKIVDKLMSDLMFKLKESSLKRERDKLKVQQKNCNTDIESLHFIQKIQDIEVKLSELRNK